MIDLRTRRREEEWMDAPGVDPLILARSLRFIRRVNKLFGYTRVTLAHLERFSRNWRRDEPIAILDVATGSADIPRAISAWALRRGFSKLQVVGIDLHEMTARIAAAETKSDPGVAIVRGDALRLPFADRSFDYVITNMFTHHLDDEIAVRVLREMDRVAARGVIWSDLLRNRRAYYWISLFTAFSNPMVKHDARVSVAQAFTRAEVLALRDRAGISYAEFQKHFGHRFVVAGGKSSR